MQQRELFPFDGYKPRLDTQCGILPRLRYCFMFTRMWPMLQRHVLTSRVIQLILSQTSTIELDSWSPSHSCVLHSQIKEVFYSITVIAVFWKRRTTKVWVTATIQVLGIAQGVLTQLPKVSVEYVMVLIDIYQVIVYYVTNCIIFHILYTSCSR